MRLKTEPTRAPATRIAIVSLFIMALLASVRLAAQGKAYIDLTAAGLGGANGALHLRGGLELPLDEPWSAVIEPGIYVAGTQDMLSVQLDLSGSARWRPAGSPGFFAGAGAGFAAALASDAPWDPDLAIPANHSLLGLKAFALAEAGWSFGKASSTISVEPYVRSVIAFGPEILQGTAPGAKHGTEWGYAVSALLGLRLVWIPLAR